MISKQNPANRFMRGPIKVSKIIQQIPYLLIGKQICKNTFHLISAPINFLLHKFIQWIIKHSPSKIYNYSNS